MVSRKYSIDAEAKEGIVTKISWQQKKENHDNTSQDYGVYFIRTNYEKPQEVQLQKQKK